MMNIRRRWRVVILCSAVLAATPACKKSDEAPATPEAKPAAPPAAASTPAPPPSAAPTTDPHAGLNIPGLNAPGSGGQDPHAGLAAPSAKVNTEGGPITLTGLALSVPPGWIPELATFNAIARGSVKAVYRLPNAEGDSTACTLRITYFPNMKGMNDMNIDRWAGQVSRPDGKPFTRDEAKIETFDKGRVRLTIVDLDGAVKTDMGGAAGAGSGRRMIAAIIDHPKGPHFVKAIGAAASMAKSADAIIAFINSAEVAE